MKASVAVVLALSGAAPAHAAGPRQIDPAAQPAVVAESGDVPAAAETPAPAEAPVPASSSPTAPKEIAPPKSPTTKDEQARPVHPKLVLGVGPIIGPHTFGNEECRADEKSCETAGTFLGAGAQTELRTRAWRWLYAHARVLAVANAAQREPVYTGLWGFGIGIGFYARYAFARAEYLFVDTFGDRRFRPPFFDADVGTDTWDHHAGLLSVGARLPFRRRLGAELWGGFMLGPRSTREIPGEEPERRLLTTFILGVNMTFDLVR